MKKLAVLIEDEGPLLLGLKLKLLGIGYKSACFTDGESAVREIKMLVSAGVPPDLIITDYELPDFSGAEVLKKLRNMGISVPAVLMSGYSGKEFFKKTGIFGSCAFLTKPFRFDELEECMKELVQSCP